MSLIELFSDYTFRTVFLGTVGIGAVSGALGCFAYLKRQSLVGDVVSHSSLLGIMLFFLVSYWVTGSGSKSLFILIPGAIFAGVCALLLTRWIISQTNVRQDSGLGVMLAIFFGTGVMLLRWVQNATPTIPGHRGLQDYLFGMAASMTQNDLIMIAIIGVSSLVVMMLLWKELKAITFDPLFTQSLGYRSKILDVLLIGLLVNGIVIGIQCIGVVLMVAMLVTPAAAARQWTGSLGSMVTLAALIGAFCGGVGAIVSAEFSNIPTGPVVVLTGALVFVVSILFSPGRGVLARQLGQRKIVSAANSGPAGIGGDQ